jgi:large subunit ribosomal protein L9
VKLILKEEVDNLGLPGDVVDVAPGYGRNYLVPRGLAMLATPGAMKEAETLTRARKAREAETLDDAQEFRDVLERRSLRIEARVDEHGTLYGSVGASEIHEVLRERGHNVERRRIDLPRSIKAIGQYTVGIRVHPQVTAEVPLEVVDVEGKVTLEGAPEDLTEAERRAAFEEEALEVAEEIEAEEEAIEEAIEEAEAEVADETAETTEALSTAEALAARASAPSEVDAPARPEDLADRDDDAEEPNV